MMIFITENTRKLERLDLSGNQISELGCQAISNRLLNLNHLELGMR
jgi:Leucine-rich repeat (LRR) protein